MAVYSSLMKFGKRIFNLVQVVYIKSMISCNSLQTFSLELIPLALHPNNLDCVKKHKLDKEIK